MHDKKPSRPLTPKERRQMARERFLRPRKAEKQYQRQLSAVGKNVGDIVEGFAPGGKVVSMASLTNALNRYAKLLDPWARAVTARMHADVQRRDAKSWTELAREMGRELRKELRSEPTGEWLREAMDLQVKLITSIPRVAAKRVHELTTEALISTSGRADEIAKEIMRSGKVAKSRAMLIARTETSRTAALLTESRARYVGSVAYRWVTVGDSDVRKEHRKLNGKIFRWEDPPIAGTNGMRYNPGCGPNCRCFAEPLLPDE